MKILFTSDLHFNHVNIRTYCPGRLALGDTLEEMNASLIARWNAVVGLEDTVYLIGDFAMGPKVLHKVFFDQLQGRKILIRGNHDGKTSRLLEMGFAEVHDRLYIDLDDKRLYLSHIPVGNDRPETPNRHYPPELVVPPAEPYDFWLAGHVHNSWRRRGNVINVGVDQWDFYPRTLQELLRAEDDRGLDIGAGSEYKEGHGNQTDR